MAMSRITRFRLRAKNSINRLIEHHYSSFPRTENPFFPARASFRGADYRSPSNFPPVSFGIVLVCLAVFFVGDLFVRAVAKRLILRQTTHADEYRPGLRFDFEWLLVGSYHFAHKLE